MCSCVTGWSFNEATQIPTVKTLHLELFQIGLEKLQIHLELFQMHLELFQIDLVNLEACGSLRLLGSSMGAFEKLSVYV